MLSGGWIGWRPVQPSGSPRRSTGRVLRGCSTSPASDGCRRRPAGRCPGRCPGHRPSCLDPPRVCRLDAVAASSLMVPLGTPAPDFALPDLAGATVRLDAFVTAPALLVAFLCNHCPYVRHIEAELGKALARYPDLAVVGVCTNDVGPTRKTDPSVWPSRRSVPAGASRTCWTPTSRSAGRTTPPARRTSSSSTGSAAWPTAVRSTSPPRATASRSPEICCGPRWSRCSPARPCPSRTGPAWAARSNGDPDPSGTHPPAARQRPRIRRQAAVPPGGAAGQDLCYSLHRKQTPVRCIT